MNTSKPYISFSNVPDTYKSYFERCILDIGLIKTFVVKEFKEKYKKTLLGFVWLLVQPLLAIVIFTFFFELVFSVKTEVPFVLYAFSGISIWYLFSGIAIEGSQCLLGHREIIQKIRFPKLLLPIYKSIFKLVEFSVSFTILFCLILYYDVSISFKIIFLPFFIFLATLLGLSFSVFLSSISYKFQSFIIVIPFMIHFGIWLTPIFYTKDILPKSFQIFLYLNPINGVLEGFRFCFSITPSLDPNYFISYLIFLIPLFIGFNNFRKNDSILSEVL